MVFFWFLGSVVLWVRGSKGARRGTVLPGSWRKWHVERRGRSVPSSQDLSMLSARKPGTSIARCSTKCPRAWGESSGQVAVHDVPVANEVSTFGRSASPVKRCSPLKSTTASAAGAAVAALGAASTTSDKTPLGTGRFDQCQRMPPMDFSLHPALYCTHHKVRCKLRLFADQASRACKLANN